MQRGAFHPGFNRPSNNKILESGDSLRENGEYYPDSIAKYSRIVAAKRTCVRQRKQQSNFQQCNLQAFQIKKPAELCSKLGGFGILCPWLMLLGCFWISSASLYLRGKYCFEFAGLVVRSNRIWWSSNMNIKSIRYFPFRNIREAVDLSGSKSMDNHVTWRVNRMAAGRILRQLFPKPADVPEWWEPSTEKFLFLDESKSPPYSLPNPECSNVMIRCSSGSRLIKLIASSECAASCESQTILLSAGKTLWYNWWYWRPISLPALNSTSVTVSYVTSFC